MLGLVAFKDFSSQTVYSIYYGCAIEGREHVGGRAGNGSMCFCHLTKISGYMQCGDSWGPLGIFIYFIGVLQGCVVKLPQDK